MINKLIFLSFLTLFSDVVADDQYKENAFLGISHRVVDTSSFKQKTSGFGYLVDLVLNDTPADLMGLKAGDIIIGVDNNDLSQVEKAKRQRFLVNYIQSKKMGDELRLLVLRKKQLIVINNQYRLENMAELKDVIDQQNEDSELKLSINNKIDRLRLMALLGTRSTLSEDEVADNKTLFPNYESISDPFSELVLKSIKDNGLTKQYENLLQRFSKNELWDDGFRLNLIRYLHRDPLKTNSVIDIRMKELEEKIHQDGLSANIQYLASWLDVPISASSLNISASVSKPALTLQQYPQYPKTEDIAEHQHFIEKILSLAEQSRKQAFAKLTKQEIFFLKKEAPLLFQRFEKSFYIDKGEKKTDKSNNTKIINLAKKIDFSSLFKSAQIMTSFLNKDWLVTLEKLLGKNKSISMETASGKVLIGGFGNNIYTHQYALIIDFEGNDIYRTDTSRVEEGLSLLIDLAGNDEYQHTRNYAQGAAFMGVGIVFDQQGNDVYTSKSYSQGFSLFGVGLLMDESGDDRYFSNHMAQGVAFWGIALLLDKAGDDNYYANFYAQGVGGTKGIAALIDSDGNDHYYATGQKESSYGVSGIFLGASQGVGIGFRGYASGGIGILLDESGSNEFRAGNFSQGVGYFYGLGIIKSSGQGNDRYQASRYSQGSSAHSAMGVLIDSGGDDRYLSLSGVSQSSSWDLSIAGLWDKAGNDDYQGSNAFAAQNGFSLFVDEQGDDHYQQILTGKGNDYHGGFSFGLFIDAAGDDRYLEGSGFTNHHKKMMNEFGLFTDL